METFTKVDGFPGLAKNNKTKLIVNTNQHEIEAARERKQKRKQKLESQEEINQTVIKLKDEITEIKSLLKQLIENQ